MPACDLRSWLSETPSFQTQEVGLPQPTMSLPPASSARYPLQDLVRLAQDFMKSKQPTLQKDPLFRNLPWITDNVPVPMEILDSSVKEDWLVLRTFLPQTWVYFDSTNIQSLSVGGTIHRLKEVFICEFGEFSKAQAYCREFLNLLVGLCHSCSPHM